MVKGSFIPSEQQENLRIYCRMRTKYIQQITRVKNQIVKRLEQSNFKIKSILSYISIKTGMKLTEAISKGETDTAKLISLCHHSVRKLSALMFETSGIALQSAETLECREQV